VNSFFFNIFGYLLILNISYIDATFYLSLGLFNLGFRALRLHQVSIIASHLPYQVININSLTFKQLCEVLGVGENYLTSLVASSFLVAIHQVGGTVKRTRTLKIWAYSRLGFPKKEKGLQDFCGTIFCK
jgi:hypothetical protein